MRLPEKRAIEFRGLVVFGIWTLITITCVFVAIIGALYIFQANYVYYPERTLYTDPGRIGLKFENVHFVTADGVKLTGWFVPNERSRGVLLFCHGNAGNISHRLESIHIFHRIGLDVFIFDYRGYGQSGGNPTELGTYKDAEAAWQYLVEERKFNPNKVIVFGRSLGGAIASWLAHNHSPGALILESTFTSLPDVAATLYPYLPVRLLLRFEYNTAEYLGRVSCPVLIVHSCDDEIMPFSHGSQLFKLTREPKNFLEISGTHNEGFITSGKDYEEGLNEFILEHFGSRILKTD
ncbi:alpha/beta hydrolase [Chloroflexota bacterium]